ncbi:hypothetical protein HD597_010639 [Nonomuraea thailandensis]|uniref:Uncharacterized protein n=1 Tax=Nonomuraea thailandensis TaxID=1188745 RepID=A0A9X2GTW1_9ACTN|nr:hypothetical protein [Nonomuraea thailandensis]
MTRERAWPAAQHAWTRPVTSLRSDVPCRVTARLRDGR